MSTTDRSDVAELRAEVAALRAELDERADVSAELPADLERLLRLDDYGALALDLWHAIGPELADDVERALLWARTGPHRVVRLRVALVDGEGDAGIDELRYLADDDDVDEATADSIRRLCDHVEATNPRARRRARYRARRAAAKAS